ncbi:Predicted exporter protein, RND superfamily [Halomicrobium zhouii]|uniref:Predicted exporter protein, RND superfamily n=1 Tax=Halomicrobium zhouii TaxID=767519 RepID=A0A1I6L8V7_9EURY|nr:MMPL family transporter [Halomicrobium zhouii]SFR99862.1 Predicted exporter protein, RND superfamily [Halomicrobium zhouii]
MDYQRYIDWADDRIVEDSRKVVIVFLLLTGVFAIGLGNISMAAGTSQFTTGLPAEEALTDINREFSSSFSADTGNTQLIQEGTNVLSKESMLRMLRAQERVEDHDELRVTSTSSAATIVATQLDPEATTTSAQIDAVEEATPTEIDQAVRSADERSPQFSGLVSSDFNRKSASASATIGLVVHEIPAGISEGSGQGGSSPLTSIQKQADFTVSSAGQGTITVFGSGMIAEEFSNVIVDSLLIVVPAAVLFIFLFLTIAYRDLADLALGLLALLITIIWTFGFMGLAGIAFSQMLIAVPPLLLAVGIDFGIHAVNRYREEQVQGIPPGPAMRTTTDQLLVAFFIVTGTTVIGFLSNFASDLPPIQDFGLVASIGIVFTFFTFGVFLPAAKVELDRLRVRYPIPTFSRTPLGSEESRLGSVLRSGVVIATNAPAVFLVLVLVSSAGVGVYASEVDTSFTQEDFLPPEETPAYLQQLPEPFKPSDYSVTEQLNFLEDKFESTQSSQSTVYVEGHLQRDDALEEIYRAGEDPPESFVRQNGRAESTSIVTVIQDHAERDPEFRRLVERNDRNDNGVPDDNLREVYDYLFASSAGDQARDYLTEDRRSTRVVYTVKSDAEQDEVTADTRQVADDFRMTATATGQTVVFKAVSDVILESALVSLALALVGATVFLVFIYWLVEGSPLLGVANMVPVLVTVALVAGSMRYFGIALNAITATILAITIGLGVDYSVHVTHRFADERERHDLITALDLTVRGTGGALLGSMLTTVFGIGVLALAVFPAIGQFGVITGMSIAYAFLASMLVLPATLVVWDALVNDDVSVRSLFLPGIASGLDRDEPAERTRS